MKKSPLYGALCALLLGVGSAPASPAPRAHAETPAAQAAAPSIWREVDESSLAAKADDRLVRPLAYRVFAADTAALERTLSGAPDELSDAAKAGSATVLEIPMPDGSLGRFRVVASPVMESALAARHPEIKTYLAQGIDDPAAAARVDLTPLGFHAQVLSPNGRVFVDPYVRGDRSTYVTYFTRDYVRSDDDFSCFVPDAGDAAKAAAPAVLDATSGQTLRTYRLAVACTGEYAVAVCSHNGVALTVDNTFAAIVTSVNRVVGVYENEVAIHMNLVANETSIIFTNSSTDPYTNGSPNQLLSQNQSTCDSAIGAANYDIGHVFSTAGGGLAGLGVVCRSGQKAQGETGTSAPYGDAYDIDYVAHEMGHQFGGNHTFNSTSGSCQGNRAASAAYEPGSGSTIMAYAGICGTADLQPHSDPYFHAKSFDEIVAYTTTGAGNGCAVQTPTGNTEPVVDAGAAYTIPANTPFELTAASASDPQGDAITYCWEEFDLGAALNTNTDNGSSPILRSYNPSTSPTRTFVKPANLVNNTTQFGEVLPTTNRTMTFRCTARDNRAGGGGVSFDTTTVTTTTAGGAFAVTAPNSATTLAGGSALNVTWNVANTTGSPVNAANVEILLSRDGGLTWPIVLRASTPNDGSETVTVPNLPTTTARIKVKAVGNVFFDISNANFTITASATGGDSVGITSSQTAAFFLRNTNASGGADLTFLYGPAPSGYVQLAGDWDGDHVDTAGLYDPATGNFFLKNSNAGGGADIAFAFGAGGAGLVPLRGDWDGDGVDTVGLYNPATGVFFLKNSNAGGGADITFQFGAGGAGLVAITGDWNGDLKDTVGLYNPATGVFFLRNQNSAGGADLAFQFGGAGNVPLAGDWNLDGVDTVGLYNAATGAWFLRNSNTPGGADAAFVYGGPNATPLTGDWDGL